MNKFWPKEWKKTLPNFLGEDFFASFEQFEDMEIETESNGNGSNETNPNFSGNNNSSSIKVNIYESGHELLCIFRLPGLKVKEVDIDVYDMILEVSGKVGIEPKGFRPVHHEIYQGPVHRKVRLPYPVRHDKVEASYHHGYLFIHLHQLIRPEHTKPKILIEDLDD